MGAPADEVLVRRATAADVPQLVGLRWVSSAEDDDVHEAGESRDEFEARMRAFLHRAVEDPRWTIWVAADGDRIVSTMYAQIVPKIPRPWPNDGWVYVTGVFTVAERRSEGIGSRVLSTVREWATARGLELLLLWPSERSVPFYERAGFHQADALELEL